MGGVENPIDRYIRLAKFAEWPSLRSPIRVSVSREKYRRLGLGYYFEGFYDARTRIALDHEGRIAKTHAPLLGACTDAIGPIRPKFIQVRGAIVADIFYQSRMVITLSYILDMCQIGGEFDSVSVDCTDKPTIPPYGLLGAIKGRATRYNRMHLMATSYMKYALLAGHSDTYYLSARCSGRTIHGYFLEGDVIFQVFLRGQGARPSIAHYAGRLPCATGCAVAQLRIAFSSDQSHWRAKNDLISRIRQILAKFTPEYYGDSWSGGFTKAFT